MKKALLSTILIIAFLTACAQSQVHFADPVDVQKVLAESDALAAEIAAAEEHDGHDMSAMAAMPEPTPAPTAAPEPTSEPEDTQTFAAEPDAEPTTEPTQAPASAPQPEPTPAPTLDPTPEPAPAPAPHAGDGAIPFAHAAGTNRWWKIDATDSAYWVVQDQINAMRTAGGLPALTMDDNLSAIASSRCESFVAGGPFDHSGMVTKSEICAAGPLGTASTVCAAWQASEVHYANIMRTDISSMGVGCWFCEVDGNQYTYWTVTFQRNGAIAKG